MLRFRLWFLAIVLSVLGIWLAGRSHEARAQRRCVGEIQARGGRVYYDYAARQGGMPAGVSSYSRLLVRLCGEDFLHNVSRVDLPAGMDGLDLDGLPSVEMVLLHGDDVDDEDVRAVAKLPRLRQLKIVSHGRPGHHRSTKVTDRSLELLGQLPTLESVAIEGRKVSPQGIESLFKAPRLKSIKIHGMILNPFSPMEVPGNVRVEFSRPRQSRCITGNGIPIEDETFYIIVGERPAIK